MIYSNAQFMDIEWEVLIKEYRKQLKDKGFKTLFEYAESFFTWLAKTEYISTEQKEKYFIGLTTILFSRIKTEIVKNVEDIIKKNGKIETNELPGVIDGIIQKNEERLLKIPINQLVCISKDFIDSKLDLIIKSINFNI